MVGVDPAEALRDVTAALNATLQDYSGAFNELVDPFQSAFSSASSLFDSITNSEKIKLSLDAVIDFKVMLDMSLDSFEIASSLEKFETSFTATIEDEFTIPLGDRPWNLGIKPSLTLFLEAENTAVPFDVFDEVSKLSQFEYGGDIDALILVAVEDVPVEVSLRASVSENLTSIDSLDYEVELDIDLDVIKVRY